MVVERVVAGLDKMAGFDTVDHMTAVYRDRLLEKETSVVKFRIFREKVV